MSVSPVECQTIVIGAGPAGLAVGACLKRENIPSIILEQNDKVGSAWHGHYDRLHLHTDKRNSELPKVPIPGLYFCGYHISPTGMLREIGIEAKQITTSIAASL